MAKEKEPDVGKSQQAEEEDLDKKKKEIEKTILLLNNIIDGGKIKRFNFTLQEAEALVFINSILEANLEMLDDEE